MKVTLIHNPDAGEGAVTSKELLQFIRAAGHDVTHQAANAPDWSAVLDAPADIIAVAGGDGIVGRVAKRSVGRGIPIAVLPLGTANNIARTLGLTDIPFAALIEGWHESPCRKVDLAMARGPWGARFFIEGMGVGIFSEIMARLDARGNADLAHLSSAEEKVAAVQEVLRDRIAHFPPFKMKVLLDGRDLSGDFILLEALNIQAVGPNLRLAPHANPADGQLDVALFYDGQQDELMRQVAELMRGDAPPQSSWFNRRGKRLEISVQGLPLHIDDEALPASMLQPVDVMATIPGDSLEFLAHRTEKAAEGGRSKERSV